MTLSDKKVNNGKISGTLICYIHIFLPINDLCNCESSITCNMKFPCGYILV